MKTITLLKMELANFKAIHSKEIDFSKSTRIVGMNATGKSSLNEAYLWCLFGKSANGTDCAVQPLDKNGEPIHKITTEVVLHLDVDGSSIVLKRQLEEQWVKPKGTNGEVLKGTPTTYFVNDVPCKASEYNDKINAICPATDWMMISNIATFNSMTTADKRRKLNEAAKHITDVSAAEGFVNVQQALKEGKSIEEFRRELCAKSKKSQTELDEIPSRLDQQEKLRITGVDFEALKKQVVDIEKEIAAIDDKLQGDLTTQSSAVFDDLGRQYGELSQAKLEIENSFINELGAKRVAVDAKIRDIEQRKAVATQKFDIATAEVAKLKDERSQYAEKIASLGEQWDAINKEQYAANQETVCPHCNRPYTAEELKQMTLSAIEQFNGYKIIRLNEKLKLAQDVKASIAATDNSINGTIRELAESKSAIEQSEHEESAAQRELSAIPTLDILKQASKEYQVVLQKLNSAQTAISAQNDSKPDHSKLKDRKGELQNEIRQMQATLGKQSINEQIDVKRKELEEQAKTLAQAVTDMDRLNFEINEFQKRKIMLVEEAVSAYFTIVRWKLFEPNITNEGERPICEALVDGVPYNELNTAMRINAGMDICTGLSKALGVSAPLFVDNKESVTELLPTTQQLITLEVVANQELTIINQ